MKYDNIWNIKNDKKDRENSHTPRQRRSPVEGGG